MESNNKTEFVTDLQNKKVTITREFDAPLENVWRAWTESDLLDQWWAPKPFIAKTKFMDFKVGGRRFYAMVSPEGQEHWSIQKYTSISPKTNFKMLNALQTKMKTLNCRVLIGMLISANKTELQEYVLLL